MLTRFFETNDLFDVFESAFPPFASHSFGHAAPRAVAGFRVRDEKDGFVLVAPLPGFKKEDLQLSLEGDTLTLKAERKPDVDKGFKLVRQERGGARIERQITLPVAVQGDAIEASLEHGVLTITVPKAPEAKPRKILVKGAASPTDLS